MTAATYLVGDVFDRLAQRRRPRRDRPSARRCCCGRCRPARRVGHEPRRGGHPMTDHAPDPGEHDMTDHTDLLARAERNARRLAGLADAVADDAQKQSPDMPMDGLPRIERDAVQTIADLAAALRAETERADTLSEARQLAARISAGYVISGDVGLTDPLVALLDLLTGDGS